MATFAFRILGPVEVARDGRPAATGPPKQRTLLVALLVEADRFVSTDRLTELIWAGEPPVSAAVNLRTYCVNLRRILADPAAPGGSRLVTGPAGVLVRVLPGELDAAEFAAGVERGRQLAADGAPADAAATLGAALALWRGPCAADLRRGHGLGARLAALDDERGDALEDLGRIRLGLGQHADLVPLLRREVVAYPLRERLWVQLMTAQYRSGEVAAALTTYDRARRTIAEQLGVEPGPDLAAAHRAVLARDEAALSAAPPASRPREVPPDIPTFVGRTAEHDAARRALTGGGPAPVVLHGPGGVGKSALAVRLAHAVAERFPDGQLYADLHAAAPGISPAAPAAVLGRFLRALGVPTADVPADRDEAAARYRSLSAGRRLLVVLDNARDEAQVRPLLPAGPSCAVLVTSRHTLAGVEAAARVALGPLGAADAVELLARLAGPGRVRDERRAAAELARLCECLPLAVRVAGARLANRPDRRLDALVDELRDERRRLDGLRFGDLAVRACFEVGYQPVADLPAGRLFRLLALPRLPVVDAAAAAALLDLPVAAAADALDALADAHLVEPVGGDRFALHDLLRLFASERLRAAEPEPERRRAVRRLLAFHLDTARRAAERLRPGDRPAPAAAPAVSFATPDDAVGWLEAELPNLLALAAQAADGPAEDARFVLDLAQATSQYLPMRGRWADISTLAALQRRVAARLDDRPAELRSLMMLATVHRERGEHDDAVRLLDEVVRGRDALGDDFGAGPALAHLGIAHARRGDLPEALRCFDASAAAYRRHDRRAGEGIARYEAGEVLLQLGEYPAALASLDASLAIRRAERDLVGEAITLVGLGKALSRLERRDEAVRLLTEALERCRRTGARDYEWQALLWRGDARRADGGDGALDDLTEALRVSRAVRNRRGEAYALRSLARVWDERGDPGRAETCRRRAAAVLVRGGPAGGPVAPDDDWPAVQPAAAAPTGTASAIRRSGPRRRSSR